MKKSVIESPEVESDEPHEYEIKDAADTLMKAEEIKKNKKLMPHVHRHLNSRKEVIKSIQDLRNKKEELDEETYGTEDEDAAPYSAGATGPEAPNKHTKRMPKA